MRLQPFGELAAAGEARDTIQRLEHVHHLPRVVADVGHVGEAELVGL